MSARVCAATGRTARVVCKDRGPAILTVAPASATRTASRPTTAAPTCNAPATSVRHAVKSTRNFGRVRYVPHNKAHWRRTTSSLWSCSVAITGLNNMYLKVQV